MKNDGFARTYFFVVLIILAVLYGIGIGRSELFPYAVLKFAKESVVQVFNERRMLVKIKPDLQLLKARYEGSGITVNNAPPERDELILLSGFFNKTNELRLLKRDGTVVARWPVQFSKFFPDTSHLLTPPATDWNVEIHGALIHPDGSVVLDFEYGGLVKLDRCGKTVWTLAEPTHHSVERAETGGYWVPGKRYFKVGEASPFPPYAPPFDIDNLLRVSEDGKVLKKIYVSDIFIKNGLEQVITAGENHRFKVEGNPGLEIVHLNKIEELTSDIAGDFPLFEAGDLLLSFRGRNLVMVIDPETLKVKWWRIGPWRRQHDPEFSRNGKIVVFNNNLYYGAPVPNRSSNIIEIDPVSDKYRILYGDKESQKMLSFFGGKVDLTPYGSLMITEFDGGRAFEVDKNGNTMWEYINRYDSERVTKITEARIYMKDYFKVSNWSCSGDVNYNPR